MALLAVLLLAAAAAAFVLAPLFRADALEDERSAASQGEFADLLSQREMALASLRDLEDDRETGKMSEADYRELKARLSARAGGPTRRGEAAQPPRAADRDPPPPVDGETLLGARGLTRRFGALVALKDVGLVIRRGEGVAVFGPNGAGKTTLARILATSLRPSSGELRFLGRDPWRVDAEARRRLGFVAHPTLLYDDLTARENLSFFGRLYGVDRVEETAEAWLETAGLAERADDPVRTFSRGMQQRLAIARALLHEPLLVVLDEPFTGLDRSGAGLLSRLLGELPRSARSFVLVTHDLAQGLELCGRWLLLARGRLAAEGAAADTTVRSLEDAYGGITAAPETDRGR